MNSSTALSASLTAGAPLGREPLVRLADNPLMVAQARRRLRRKQAVPTFIVTGLLSLVVLLGAPLDGGGDAWQLSRGLLFMGFVLLLFGGGATRISIAVSEDRRSRLLDFHRATPTTPWTDTLGYILGAPAREYIAAAIVLPFLLAACLMVGNDPLALLVGLALTCLNAWVLFSFVMFTSLTSKRKSGRKMSPLAAIVFLLFMAPHVVGAFAVLGHMTPLPAFFELGLLDAEAMDVTVPALHFFGVPIGHVTYTLVLQLTILLFMGWACVRKLGREGTHAFSRRGGLAFYAALVVLLLGPVLDYLTDKEFLAPATTFFLLGTLLFATAMCIGLVPSYLGHVRAVRRAQRLGTRVPPLADEASAWPLVPAFMALVVAGFFVIAFSARSRGTLAADLVFAPEVFAALGACAAFLAFAVGAWEFARLGRRGATRSTGFLVAFVVLVMPWLVGWLVTMAGSEDVASYAFATCPLYAVGGAAFRLGEVWSVEDPQFAWPRMLVSIGLTVCYAAWFHAQAAGVRRRVAEEAASVERLASA